MKSVAILEFPMGSIAGVRSAVEGGSRQMGERSWMRERTQQTDPILLDATLTWMARLPKEMRPMALARSFPRIANYLASLWRRVSRCEEYLDALVVDHRGNRTGFPCTSRMRASASAARGWSLLNKCGDDGSGV